MLQQLQPRAANWPFNKHFNMGKKKSLLSTQCTFYSKAFSC